MTHICVSILTIIGSDNGLLRGRHQAIIWTNAGILLIRPLGTNFNEMLIVYAYAGLPSVTEFQYFVTEIALSLLKF